MTEINIEKFRKILLREKKQIFEQISKGPDLPPHMNPDRDDLAQDFISIEKDVAIRAIEREQLDQIDEALERLDSGQFGICTNCKELIPIERLKIIPYAELCVRCQSTHDRHW